MLLLLLLLRLCALCSTAVMRRLSIDAMCVKRAARCARGAVTRPRAQSTYHFFADRSRLRQKQNSAQSTRVSMQHQQSTKHTAAYRCCVCTLPRLRRIRRPRVGMASPHGPCLWWGTGSSLCSPGQQDYCSKKKSNPKNKPNPNLLWRYGHFRPIYEAVFWKLIIGIGGIAIDQTISYSEHRKHHIQPQISLELWQMYMQTDVYTWYTFPRLLTTARPRRHRKTSATVVDTDLRSS